MHISDNDNGNENENRVNDFNFTEPTKSEFEEAAEERAQSYAVPIYQTATEAQLKYIQILLRDGFLSKEDILPTGHYFRKKKLSVKQAHEFIKLGKKRIANEREQRKKPQYRW